MGKKKQNRPVFRIKHASGQTSIIRSHEFFSHIDYGNLIQTPGQRAVDFALAYVHPGLVAYYDNRERLVFEYAQRVERTSIEAMLINDFGYAPDWAAEVARLIISERERARELARHLTDNVWERLYLKHMLRSGSIAATELDVRMREGMPVVEGEKILSNDRKTTYQFTYYR